VTAAWRISGAAAGSRRDAAALLARHRAVAFAGVACSAGSSNRSSQPSCRSSAASALELSDPLGPKRGATLLIHRLRQGQADGEERQAGGQRLKAAGQPAPAPAPAREPNGWRPVLVEDNASRLASRSARRRRLLSDQPPVGPNSRWRCGVLRLTVELSAIESLSGEKPAPVNSAGREACAGSKNAASHRRSGHGRWRTERNTVMCAACGSMKREAAVGETLRGPGGPVWVNHGIAPGKLKRGLRQMAGTPAWRAASATLKRAMVDRLQRVWWPSPEIGQFRFRRASPGPLASAGQGQASRMHRRSASPPGRFPDGPSGQASSAGGVRRAPAPGVHHPAAAAGSALQLAELSTADLGLGCCGCSGGDF